MRAAKLILTRHPELSSTATNTAGADANASFDTATDIGDAGSQQLELTVADG
jgi:hypothetical protein